jgi:hypothetical protein
MILGNAIERLVSRLGGQLLLEVPDDLPEEFVGRLVTAINGDQAAEPPLCLFVHDRRPDVEGVAASVSFRDWGGYRHGNRLAVVYASDNRGMSTFTSVYPLLFAPGFPGEGSPESIGVASLDELVEDIVGALVAERALGEVATPDFSQSIRNVARYLAGAYSESGNGQSSFATDWWLHLDTWLGSLSHEIHRDNARDLACLTYATAGLPRPANCGKGLHLSAGVYVKILRERWADAQSIQRELERLSLLERASKAARELLKLDWDDEVAQLALRTDSPPSQVGLVGLLPGSRPEEAVARVAGWSALDEESFAHSFEYAKGKLVLGVGTQQLPSPWPDAAGVLVADPELERDDGVYRVDGFWFTIPRKAGAIGGPESVLERTANDITIKGGTGELVEFQPDKATAAPDGLRMNGTVLLRPSRKSPNSVRFHVEVVGETARYVADKSDASLTFVKPNQAAMLVRKIGGRGRKQARGPVIWTVGSGTTQLRIESRGKLEVAIAVGAESGIAPELLRVGNAPLDHSWEGQSREAFALGELEIQDSVRVAAQDIEPFELSLDSDPGVAPIAPIRAAAQGVSPRLQRPLDPADHRSPKLLGQLEVELGKMLSHVGPDECALGAVLLPTSESRSPLVQVAPGVLANCELESRLDELVPVPPTNALTARDSYRQLVDAYDALGIPDHIDSLERELGAEYITISRLSLDFLTADQVSGVLNAYDALLRDLGGLSPSDAFWARHPFSVAIYPYTQGELTIQAVLLSPLHPIRLGWMWKVQASLRAVQEDEGEATALQALALSDSSAFPSVCHGENGFGQPVQFVPVPVDAAPEDLYLGWHASVSLLNGHFNIPERLMGFRFPVQGHSGLSAGSVVAAIDDFMRVSPEVQAIRVKLAAKAPLPRSTSIDAGIAEKLGSLAEASSGLDGVMGVTILDSTNRLGSAPSLGHVRESLIHGRPGFHFEWKSVKPEDLESPHITFLEGLAATAAVMESGTQPSGWLPNVPLRRFPHRDGSGNVATLGYALAAAPQGDMGLWAAIREYESPSSRRYELHVRPNLSDFHAGPNWMVASDFGVDPQAVAAASARMAGSRYLLWDWRPVPTTRIDEPLGGGSRPYFIVASIPDALTTAIRERIAKLRPGLDQDALARRVRALVQKLSSRAIGLNSLIAIGHHQATGALGFYFALTSLERWVTSVPDGTFRMLVPVDAVDGFLSGLVVGGQARHKRADLLAVQVDVGEPHPQVTLIPIEVKHYGLNNQAEAVPFPSPGDAQLQEHIQQLSEYQHSLSSLCDTYEKAVGGRASVMGQQLATVVEAAVQLNPTGDTRKAGAVLRALVEGRAQLAVGKGVLLWYQARGTTTNGHRLVVDQIDDAPGAGRVEVRVDPMAYDAELWQGQDGEAHEAVNSAMLAALEHVVAGQDDGEQESGGKSDGPAPEDVPVAANTTENGSREAPDRPSEPLEESIKRESRARGRMDRRRLAELYRRVLGVLTEFKVSVEVPKDEEVRFREGPAFLQFAVDPAYGVPVSRIEAQLGNLKLRLNLAADQSIGASTHQGHVVLTVPKADPDRYFISTAELWAQWSAPSGKFQIPLGEDIGGSVVTVDLASSNSPHLLIAGVTGSGKSEALLTMLRGAAHFYPATELRFFLVDPKRVELGVLEGDPHTHGEIGYTAEDAIQVLTGAVLEMEQRYSAFQHAKVRDIVAYQDKFGAEAMPRWLIVLDEYADLVTDDGERKEIEKLLKQLSQKARAAGIHLIVSTQKPVKEVVNTVVKGNLPGRIALRVNSNTESRVILDEGGAEQLVGKGDALLKVGNQVTRLQFAKHD